MIEGLGLNLPVMLVAAVVQGSTGFGFGLVAVGSLSLFLHFADEE